MHLIVGIFGITLVLVLDEGEAVKACQSSRLVSGRVQTYSLLDAVRGAGMSQRTKRPYLEHVSEMLSLSQYCPL